MDDMFCHSFKIFRCFQGLAPPAANPPQANGAYHIWKM